MSTNKQTLYKNVGNSLFDDSPKLGTAQMPPVRVGRGRPTQSCRGRHSAMKRDEPLTRVVRVSLAYSMLREKPET